MPCGEVQVCHFGLMQVSHIGETGQNLHGPTYERTQQYPDDWWPWMAREDKEKKSKIQKKSDCRIYRI